MDMDPSRIDWSKVRIGNVYLNDLSPEERKKYEPWLTPEKRAEHKRLAELEDQDMEYWQVEGDKIDAERMKEGMPARSAIGALRRLARRQGLSDEDIMARSGLDAAALATMSGRDAKPTIETMEAYARALGKQLLIVLADAEEEG
jgi:hypothetical protein